MKWGASTPFFFLDKQSIRSRLQRSHVNENLVIRQVIVGFFYTFSLSRLMNSHKLFAAKHIDAMARILLKA
jgi:hypothetical protein